MATSTAVFQFRKPTEASDFVDVDTDLNDNWDKAEAALIARPATQFARKLIDQSWTSTGLVWANDDDLFFPVVAGNVYEFEYLLLATGSAAAGIEYQITYPGGVFSLGTLFPDYDPVAQANLMTVPGDWRGTSEETVSPSSWSMSAATNSLTFPMTHIIKGLYECTTSGSVQLKVRQVNSGTTITKLRAGSFLVARKL